MHFHSNNTFAVIYAQISITNININMLFTYTASDINTLFSLSSLFFWVSTGYVGFPKRLFRAQFSIEAQWVVLVVVSYPEATLKLLTDDWLIVLANLKHKHAIIHTAVAFTGEIFTTPTCGYDWQAIFFRPKLIPSIQITTAVKDNVSHNALHNCFTNLLSKLYQTRTSRAFSRSRDCSLDAGAFCASCNTKSAQTRKSQCQLSNRQHALHLHKLQQWHCKQKSHSIRLIRCLQVCKQSTDLWGSVLATVHDAIFHNTQSRCTTVVEFWIFLSINSFSIKEYKVSWFLTA